MVKGRVDWAGPHDNRTNWEGMRKRGTRGRGSVTIARVTEKEEEEEEESVLRE